GGQARGPGRPALREHRLVVVARRPARRRWQRPRDPAHGRDGVGPVSRTASALALALVLVAALASGVAAAEPTFGKATVSATFLDGIKLEQRVSLPSGVHRVEAYVREGSDAHTFLAYVAPGTRDHLLTYTCETPAGSIYPNTHIQRGFRLTVDDGHV